MNNEENHKKLMRRILNEISDKPLVLKGGTALMLAYGLDRFSEDLDFDVSTKFKGNNTINLENTLKNVSRLGDMKVSAVSTRKNTDTVTRYMLTYETSEIKNSKLKLEISYRKPIDETRVVLKDNIKFAPIEEIANFKINSVLDTSNDSRTKARDLYDTAFIAEKHPQAITDNQLKLLGKLDLSKIESRYSQDFSEDTLLKKTTAGDVALKLGIAVENELKSRAKKNFKSTLNKVRAEKSSNHNSDINNQQKL